MLHAMKRWMSFLPYKRHAHGGDHDPFRALLANESGNASPRTRIPARGISPMDEEAHAAVSSMGEIPLAGNTFQIGGRACMETDGRPRGSPLLYTHNGQPCIVGATLVVARRFPYTLFRLFEMSCPLPSSCPACGWGVTPCWPFTGSWSEHENVCSIICS